MSVNDGRFEEGLAIRRAVLGAAYVDRSISASTDFNRPLQELVTEYCWGTIWARPGLERRTRSLINIAMLTALNHQHELELHVGGALRNGCSEEEIQEVLLQAAIYCGVPAAVAAFRSATRALDTYAQAQAEAGAGAAGSATEGTAT